MRLKSFTLILMSSILLLSGCAQSQASSNESSESSESNSSDSASLDNGETSFENAIQKTNKNFELQTTYYEKDNLEPSNNHFMYKSIRFDGENQIYWNKYVSAYSNDEEDLINLKSQEEAYTHSVYYMEGETILERYKTPDDVWKQFTYTPTFSFDGKITDLINPEHFELKEDGFYYMIDEYLGSEECSTLGGYYGSYRYLIQDFDYVAF